MAFASEILSLVAISNGAKLSAIDTTTYPARTMARQMTTDLTFIGISMATVDPLSKPSLLSAYATNLQSNSAKQNLALGLVMESEMHLLNS